MKHRKSTPAVRRLVECSRALGDLSYGYTLDPVSGARTLVTCPCCNEIAINNHAPRCPDCGVMLDALLLAPVHLVDIAENAGRFYWSVLRRTLCEEFTDLAPNDIAAVFVHPPGRSCINTFGEAGIGVPTAKLKQG